MTQSADNVSNTPQSQVTIAPPTPEADFSPVAQSVQKGRWIFTQIRVFLTQLNDNLGRFWQDYKQSMITVAIILAAVIAFRIALAIVGALNDIPLVAPTFKLVGVGYSVWFIYRYLLKPSTRQELSQKIQEFLNK